MKIPPGAIKAAAEAIMTAQNANDDEAERHEARALATAALKAAAPALIVAERARIRDLAIEAGATVHDPRGGVKPFADLIDGAP